MRGFQSPTELWVRFDLHPSLLHPCSIPVSISYGALGSFRPPPWSSPAHSPLLFQSPTELWVRFDREMPGWGRGKFDEFQSPTELWVRFDPLDAKLEAVKAVGFNLLRSFGFVSTPPASSCAGLYKWFQSPTELWVRFDPSRQLLRGPL